MATKNGSLLASFRAALAGFKHLARAERNTKYHALAVVVALALAWFFEVSVERLALVVLAIGGVVAFELVNTALESLEDIIEPKWHTTVGRSKDMAAAAVLTMSIAALVIGFLVFLF